MAFSEDIKKEVRRKSMFRCCRCQEIGVDIHHILPQKDNGPDTIENAAPLCPNCHDGYGDNPQKRKSITEMRDVWYAAIERKYPSEGLPESIQTVIEKIFQLEKKFDEQVDKKDLNLEELKLTLKQLIDQRFENVTSANISSFASAAINFSAPSPVSDFCSWRTPSQTEHCCSNCHDIFEPGCVFATTENSTVCTRCGQVDYGDWSYLFKK